MAYKDHDITYFTVGKWEDIHNIPYDYKTSKVQVCTLLKD